jgi:hypothetical protein
MDINLKLLLYSLATSFLGSEHSQCSVQIPCGEAGYNTATVALQVVSYKAMKWERGVSWYNWATLSLGDINTGAWSSRFGVGRKAEDLAF